MPAKHRPRREMKTGRLRTKDAHIKRDAKRATRQPAAAPPHARDNARTSHKPRQTPRHRIYAERRNGGHPRAHKAALTRPCSHPGPTLQTQAKVKGNDLRLSGVGSPTPAIQASKPPASRQIKGDLTARTAKAKPAPASRRTGKTTGTSRPPSVASKTPARAPPPARQRPAHPGVRTGTRNPRPGSRNQVTESGQSQEPSLDESDINPYTGMRQARNSSKPCFRIIDITSLYRHCHGIAQGSPNHLTNVALRHRGGSTARCPSPNLQSRTPAGVLTDGARNACYCYQKSRARPWAGGNRGGSWRSNNPF